MSRYQHAGVKDNIKRGDNPLKLWNSSSIFKLPELIKILLMKTFAED